MAAHPSLLVTPLLDEDRDILEGLIQPFDESWKRNIPPDLATFLARAPERLRLRTLVELVKVDQEFRWQRGERRSLEAYLGEWPELASD
jgi:hypothetical protein